MSASRFRFHPAAEVELNDAANWYEDRREGLGFEFLKAVRAKIANLVESPSRWRLVNGTRRVLLGRFPYATVYREVPDDEQAVEIVAIAHFKRRPQYWARR